MSPEHNPSGLEAFVAWGNNLYEQDTPFAEIVINGLVEQAFPESDTLDKTE